jgi:hypothetical protein
MRDCRCVRRVLPSAAPVPLINSRLTYSGEVILVSIQPAPVDSPKACPFCKSADVTTSSKAVNASTYWRCVACGEIWNADRLQDGRRTPSYRFG